jgi:hypothetical protein
MWVALSDERTGLSFTTAAGPRQSSHYRDPSPVGLVTIFYCLRFETSLFVASYDSQGHGGGIRPRLHTGLTCQLLMTYRYIVSGRTTQKTHPLSTNGCSLLLRIRCAGCLLSRCLAMGLFVTVPIQVRQRFDSQG